MTRLLGLPQHGTRWNERLTLLESQLATVNRMAAANELPDALITESGLKITPLDAAVPETAQALIDQTAISLPHVKITELLLEVDEWTGFTRHFTHLKSGDLAKDKHLLLTTILQYLSPLGWEHINLTGDYLWRSSARIGGRPNSRVTSRHLAVGKRPVLVSRLSRQSDTV